MKLNNIKESLIGYEMNFCELDDQMMAFGYYSVFDDGVTADIKEDGCVVYTNTETQAAEVVIYFEIVYDNGEDEAEEAFTLIVVSVEEF